MISKWKHLVHQSQKIVVLHQIPAHDGINEFVNTQQFLALLLFQKRIVWL